MNELSDGNAPNEKSDFLPEEMLSIDIHVDLRAGSIQPQQIVTLPVRVSALIRFVAALKNIIYFPKPIGRLVFDLLGRHDIADSSSVMLGWVVILAVILLSRGFIPFDTLIDWLLKK